MKTRDEGEGRVFMGAARKKRGRQTPGDYEPYCRLSARAIGPGQGGRGPARCIKKPPAGAGGWAKERAARVRAARTGPYFLSASLVAALSSGFLQVAALASLQSLASLQQQQSLALSSHLDLSAQASPPAKAKEAAERAVRRRRVFFMLCFGLRVGDRQKVDTGGRQGCSRREEWRRPPGWKHNSRRKTGRRFQSHGRDAGERGKFCVRFCGRRLLEGGSQ